MTKCRSKLKKPCSSSIASANGAYLRYKFPSSLDSSLALICHDKNVYEEIIFCKASQYKSQLHFLHKITGLARNLPISNNQP